MKQEPTAQELLDMCLAQEAKYQFDTLSRTDIWKLGNILAELTKDCYKPVGVEIKVNGLILFSYYPEGTTTYYHMVLEWKHNTANVMEKSSLRFYAETQLSRLDPEKDMILDRTKFQFRGGSFPIKLRNGCVIGSIAAAGMAHTDDHGLIIRGLERYFAEQ